MTNEVVGSSMIHAVEPVDDFTAVYCANLTSALNTIQEQIIINIVASMIISAAEVEKPAVKQGQQAVEILNQSI
jgi:hypothetical protein